MPVINDCNLQTVIYGSVDAVRLNFELWEELLMFSVLQAGTPGLSVAYWLQFSVSGIST